MSCTKPSSILDAATYSLQDIVEGKIDLPCVVRWTSSDSKLTEGRKQSPAERGCEDTETTERDANRTENGDAETLPEASRDLAVFHAVRRLHDEVEVFDDEGGELLQELSIHDKDRLFEVVREDSCPPLSSITCQTEGKPYRSLRTLLEGTGRWQRRIVLLSSGFVDGETLPPGTEIVLCRDMVRANDGSEIIPAKRTQRGPSETLGGAVTLPFWRLPASCRTPTSSPEVFSAELPPRSPTDNVMAARQVVSLVHVPIDMQITCALSSAGGPVHFLDELKDVLPRHLIKAVCYPVHRELMTSDLESSSAGCAMADLVTLRTKTFVLATEDSSAPQLLWSTPTHKSGGDFQIVPDPGLAVYRNACHQLATAYDLDKLRPVPHTAILGLGTEGVSQAMHIADQPRLLPSSKETNVHYEVLSHSATAAQERRPAHAERTAPEGVENAPPLPPRPVPPPRRKPRAASKEESSTIPRPPNRFGYNFLQQKSFSSGDEDTANDSRPRPRSESYKMALGERSQSFRSSQPPRTANLRKKSLSLHRPKTNDDDQDDDYIKMATVPRFNPKQARKPSPSFRAMQKALSDKLLSSSLYQRGNKPEVATLPVYYVLEKDHLNPTKPLQNASSHVRSTSCPPRPEDGRSSQRSPSPIRWERKELPKLSTPKRPTGPPPPIPISAAGGVAKKKAPPPPKPARTDLGYVHMNADCDDHQKTTARGRRLFYQSTSVMPQFPMKKADSAEGSAKEDNTEHEYDYILPNLATCLQSQMPTCPADGYEDVLVPDQDDASCTEKCYDGDASDYEEVEPPQPPTPSYIVPIA